jgi:hypothetical protein
MNSRILFILVSIAIYSCIQLSDNKSINRILEENALPGTLDWLIEVDEDSCTAPEDEFLVNLQLLG